jgi:hypothetical protein
MTDNEHLARIEAMLAELIRRFTPREAIPALQARLADYRTNVSDAEKFSRWLAGDPNDEVEHG